MAAPYDTDIGRRHGARQHGHATVLYVASPTGQIVSGVQRIPGRNRDKCARALQDGAGAAEPIFRRLVVFVVGCLLVVSLAACAGDDPPDPQAAKAATATGELVGTTLAKVVAQLRQVLAEDPALTAKQGLQRVEAGASLNTAGEVIDEMLTRKGLDLSEMMFRFSEGVAFRLPPVPGVVFEPNRRPQYERQYERRNIMRRYAIWAVLRAMLVDEGPPKPFRSHFVEDHPPPPELLDPNGNIVVPYAEGQEFSALSGWIADDPDAGDALVLLTGALGF